jgi:xylulose-5-phosphate/fructose-6-phosphate phosphoketolase
MCAVSAAGSAKAVETPLPLSPEELQKVHAYWRAANYLSVGQIYLYDNPLLHEPLQLKHVKPRLLGHWGTTPGLNFVYVHLNRIIRKHDLNVVYVAGPGHGGPGLVAPSTKAVSLDTRSRTLMVRRSTIRTCLFVASSEMAKRKPALSPRAGTPTNS